MRGVESRLEAKVQLVDRKTQEEREDAQLAPYGMRSAASRGRRYPEAGASAAHVLPARPRPGHPQLVLPAARVQDAGLREPRGRQLPHAPHPQPRRARRSGARVARALGLNEELTECLVLGHDLGHTPFGHSGERVMDELMSDHGGFEHNRQTLRILEVLEERYPGFPGLNLTWEVREGIIKHRPDERRRRARRSTRRARPRPSRRSSSTSWTRSPTTTTTSTTACARACSPSSRSARCALFREAHDDVLAPRGSADERIAAPPGGAPDHQPLQRRT